MDESSTKRKSRKRGRSLIFKSFFPQTSSDDDAGGKMLASDDNLVYCDVSNNGVNGDQYAKMKPSPSRGRMSSLFKAVLFDTAMKKKKKIRPKKASTPATGSTNSAPVLEDKTENLFNNNNQNMTANGLAADNNSQNDSSNVVSLPPETDTSPAANINKSTNDVDCSNVDSSTPKSDTPPPTVETGSQTLTKRKVTSPLKSVVKKPPLPSGSRSLVKRNPERDCKPATLSNSTTRLCLFVVVVVFVSVILWMRFRTNVTESIDSDQYTNMVVGDEL